MQQLWLVFLMVALAACGGGPGAEAVMAPETFRVSGQAVGADGPLQVRLNDDETVTVEDDGSFEFLTDLMDGDPFFVTVVDHPPGQVAVVSNGFGRIDGADATDVRIECLNDNADLADLQTSAPDGLVPAFDPGTTEYAATVPFLATSIEVAPAAADPGSIVTVDGLVVTEEQPSVAVPLGRGRNAIDVEVVAPSGRVQRTRVTVDRALLLAQRAYGKAPVRTSSAFGHGIATSGDLLAVGAPNDSSTAVGVDGDPGAIDELMFPASGAVHLYRRNTADPSGWEPEAYLKASNPGRLDQFGHAVAASGDTVAVGAPDEDSGATGIDGDQLDESAPNSGAVYVFRRGGTGAWAQEAYVKASNTGASDSFGFSVALSGDTLAVGAPNEGAPSGAVYVFRRSGTTWVQEAYLKASDPDGGFFGWDVALEGDRLVVGASSARSGGAAYVFTRTDDGSGATWEPDGVLEAPGTAAFGRSVALSGDTIAVGASNEDLLKGAAYVFRRFGGGWVQEARLAAAHSDDGDLFGWDVALHRDTLAVAARDEDSSTSGIDGDQADNGAENAGAVHVFRRADGAWLPESYVKASNPDAGDWFGFALGLTGGTLIVGAREEDGSATGFGGSDTSNGTGRAGAIYTYE